MIIKAIVVKYDNTMNLATQYMQDYKNDTEYLLQRLERYEKALKTIVNYDDGIIRQYEEVGELCSIYENIANEALKE